MHKSKGFSLLELSIVIAVIAILAGVATASKGFIDAAKITKAASAIETTRVAVETLIARRGGQWYHRVQAYNVYNDDLVTRHLVPEMPWRVADINISVAAVGDDSADAVHDRNHVPIYIVAKGPLVQLRALFERLENHHLFANASGASNTHCTPEDEPFALPHDIYQHNFCFQRSL
ncbi:MAG: prepilin-type N-terminal cleavage/methylation domain-containing protein [Myxococcota bacterium]|jgi:prepilin-type N-terminal cleavage/methylation domain-containing protein|nr:prepilin-type N-terminal cleavage/methylation domain-containing protein [Myxococcota bacterium]